jgi:hypothetical protein
MTTKRNVASSDTGLLLMSRMELDQVGPIVAGNEGRLQP